MSEEEENKPTTNNSGDGDKSEELSPIDKANAAAERLEAATRRLEEIRAKEIIEGRSVVNEVKPEPKEPTEEDLRQELKSKGW